MIREPDHRLAFQRRAADLLDLLLPHRQFEDAMARFHEFAASRRPDLSAPDVFDGADRFGFAGDDPDHGDHHVQALMFVGPSGAGKSSALKWIASQPDLASKMDGPDGDTRPVIQLDVPDPPTPKEVVREICSALHSPVPKKWTKGQISTHLRNLFRDVGLQYLLMDEAHVFVDGLTARAAQVNARFLKFMLVHCRVPIILAGEEPLEDLLHHKALARRTQPPVRLGAYQWGNAQDIAEWLGLMASLVERLGFKGSSLAADVNLAMRVYLDTGGIIGQLAKRLVEAGRFANAERAVDITDKHFSQAWQRWDRERGGIAADPFKILADSASSIANDPYRAPRKRLKELWTASFHSTLAGDVSRRTRRGGRKNADAERGFRR